MKYNIFLKKDDTRKQEITNLWDNLSSKTSGDRYTWLYKQNPDGETFTCLAELSDTKKVVGSASVYSRKCFVSGDVINTGVACDFVTEKEHRVFGPAMNLQKAIAEEYKNHNMNFVLAYPSMSSKAVFQRAGYKPLGDVSPWTKYLNFEPVVNKIIKFKPISFVMGFFINIFFRTIDALDLIFKKGDFLSGFKTSFDKEFDEFWNRCKTQYQITFDRSCEYLNWRYCNHPAEKYNTFVVWNKKDTKLAGYVVYKSLNNTALVFDLLYDKSMIKAGHLLLLFCKEMRKQKQNNVYLTFLGDPGLENQLSKVRFIQRKQKRMCYILMNGQQTYSHSDSWFLFEGDMDI